MLIPSSTSSSSSSIVSIINETPSTPTIPSAYCSTLYISKGLLKFELREYSPCFISRLITRRYCRSKPE